MRGHVQSGCSVGQSSRAPQAHNAWGRQPKRISLPLPLLTTSNQELATAVLHCHCPLRNPRRKTTARRGEESCPCCRTDLPVSRHVRQDCQTRHAMLVQEHDATASGTAHEESTIQVHGPGDADQSYAAPATASLPTPGSPDRLAPRRTPVAARAHSAGGC